MGSCQFLHGQYISQCLFLLCDSWDPSHHTPRTLSLVIFTSPFIHTSLTTLFIISSGLREVSLTVTVSLVSSRNVFPVDWLVVVAAMPEVLGLTYAFNLLDLRLGLGNGAGCSSKLGSSCVMTNADYPFGQGMLYLKTTALCVTFSFVLHVMPTCLSIAQSILSYHLTSEFKSFLEAVVELLRLLPMCTPLTVLVFCPRACFGQDRDGRRAVSVYRGGYRLLRTHEMGGAPLAPLLLAGGLGGGGGFHGFHGRWHCDVPSHSLQVDAWCCVEHPGSCWAAKRHHASVHPLW